MRILALALLACAALAAPAQAACGEPGASWQRATPASQGLAHQRVSRTGRVTLRVGCPERWPGDPQRRCRGTATLEGAGGKFAYDLPAGRTAYLRFTLTKARRRARTQTLRATATNADVAGGTVARIGVTVRR